jgi:nucleotide sugar dehydrogenase
VEKIAVYGLGHLGRPLAFVFAKAGFDVIGIDPNYSPSRFDIEPGLDFDNPQIYGFDKPQPSDISFIVVPTPSLPNGSFDHRTIAAVLHQISKVNESGHVAVIVSTVSPGTCEHLQFSFPTLKIVYNPTFIAIGNVISGLTYPDLLLIASSDTEARHHVLDIWVDVFDSVNNFDHRPYGVSTDFFVEVELIKLSVNAALGTKISLANSLGQLFEAYGVDPAAVKVIGHDHRIGTDFFVPGGPITGPCLPRDNYALRRAAKEVDLELPISTATDKVNVDLFWRIYRKIQFVPVGILGTSYKYGTDLDDYSVGHWLEIRLSKAGRKYFTYDEILPSDTLEEVLDCKTIVVTQKEYRDCVKVIDQTNKHVIDVWS